MMVNKDFRKQESMRSGAAGAFSVAPCVHCTAITHSHSPCIGNNTRHLLAIARTCSLCLASARPLCVLRLLAE